MRDPTSEEMDKIRKALAAGRKIEAIKIYRGISEQGLKECKKYVDSMIIKLVEEEPVKYKKVAQSGSGCMSVFAVSLGLTAMLVVSQVM